jgi:hypothetical protein
LFTLKKYMDFYFFLRNNIKSTIVYLYRGKHAYLGVHLRDNMPKGKHAYLGVHLGDNMPQGKHAYLGVHLGGNRQEYPGIICRSILGYIRGEFVPNLRVCA